jgi:hypothetical protein
MTGTLPPDDRVDDVPSESWFLDHDIAQMEFYARIATEKIEAARREWETFCRPRQGPNSVDWVSVRSRLASVEVMEATGPPPEPSDDELAMMEVNSNLRQWERRRDGIVQELRALRRERDAHRHRTPSRLPMLTAGAHRQRPAA